MTLHFMILTIFINLKKREKMFLKKFSIIYNNKFKKNKKEKKKNNKKNNKY